MHKTRKNREYRFKIDAFSPTTIPMSRLAEYVSDLAKMFGNNNSVHLLKIEEGSTVPLVMVEWEAEPKVRDRMQATTYSASPVGKTLPKWNSAQSAKLVSSKVCL